ncbi:glucosamine inositolphosphorylceramide transferase family protein [Prochlorococcus marinus]|uniref:glucosamine inositolphosphorylceramide transferase family protein n=1 Tax=Prochlorococcus marinus TaxID=1219 RepID=UPI001ADB87D2|nr:hypothetical protein [Prochlorococcus marinus]MBO8204975.1 hypothetical protein [Prochlorococcus marinus CUG1415]MBW3044248.1 hypothetical protein [Prochlorococcus marinus str. MU1415]
MNRKKVGIIINSNNISDELNDFLNESKYSKYYKVEYIIFNKYYVLNKNLLRNLRFLLTKKCSNNFFKILNIFSFDIIITLEKILFKLLRLLKSRKFIDFNRNNFKIKKLSFFPIFNADSGLTYNEKEIIKFKKLRIDILIYEGDLNIPNSLISLCKFGLVNLNYFSEKYKFNKYSTFLSIINKDSTTDFSINIISSNSLQSKIIIDGKISTNWLYSLNIKKLKAKAYAFLNLKIEAIINDHIHKKTEEEDINNRDVIIYKNQFINNFDLYYPNIFLVIKYIFNCISKIFPSKYIWAVGYQFSEDFINVDLGKSRLIKNPKGRWLADPFVYFKNNIHYCFVEDLNLNTKKGAISVFELNKKNHKELGIALSEDFHLSYPFLFEAYDSLYMCPATPDAKEIRLYKCMDFPLKWKLEKILISNIHAVDTNIFYFKNKWWILTNLSSSKIGDNNSELHIFYSENLFTNEWKKHPKNPVIFNPNHARNGGLIINNDQIYRVYQKHKFNEYGFASGLAKIINISENTYEEKKINQFLPTFFKDIKGTHTLNFKDNCIVFDIKLK